MICEEMLVRWLQKAYSLENEGIVLLSKHREDANKAEMPDIESMVSEHLELTKRHMKLIKAEIDRLGSVIAVSSHFAELKDEGKIVETYGANEQIINDLIEEHSREHLEKARYLAIAHLAEICGEDDVRDNILEIVDEEIEMASRLEEFLLKAVDRDVDRKIEAL
ncbi:MAG TPA: DUF892 family protein [bacterium]|nr:DUF892 family protein [bacterium]